MINVNTKKVSELELIEEVKDNATFPIVQDYKLYRTPITKITEHIVDSVNLPFIKYKGTDIINDNNFLILKDQNMMFISDIENDIILNEISNSEELYGSTYMIFTNTSINNVNILLPVSLNYKYFPKDVTLIELKSLNTLLLKFVSFGNERSVEIIDGKEVNDEVQKLLNEKVNITDFEDQINLLKININNKQNKLIEGDNIIIKDNLDGTSTISSSGGGGSGVIVVQTIGDSSTKVMSQNAVTEALTTKLDKKLIGAVNHVQNSNFSRDSLFPWVHYGTVIPEVLYDDKIGHKFIRIKDGTLNQNIDTTIDSIYTFSMWAKSDTLCSLDINNSASNKIGKLNIDVINKWTKLVCYFEIRDNALFNPATLTITFDKSNINLDITCVQYEVGELVTDWEPSKADLEFYINEKIKSETDRKVDKDSVYTKQESDNLFNLKANLTDVYLKSQTYSRTEIDKKISNITVSSIGAAPSNHTHTTLVPTRLAAQTSILDNPPYGFFTVNNPKGGTTGWNTGICWTDDNNPTNSNKKFLFSGLDQGLYYKSNSNYPAERLTSIEESRRNFLPLAGGTMTGDIVGKKIQVTSDNNTLTGAAVQIIGNGSPNTIYPSLVFHQPTVFNNSLYSDRKGHISVRSGDNAPTYFEADGFKAKNKNDSHILRGDGGVNVMILPTEYAPLISTYVSGLVVDSSYGRILETKINKLVTITGEIYLGGYGTGESYAEIYFKLKYAPNSKVHTVILSPVMSTSSGVGSTPLNRPSYGYVHPTKGLVIYWNSGISTISSDGSITFTAQYLTNQ